MTYRIPTDGVRRDFSVMTLAKVDSASPQPIFNVRDATGREVMSLISEGQNLVFRLAETPDTENVVQLGHGIVGKG